jgi:hypothetical protein
VILHIWVNFFESTEPDHGKKGVQKEDRFTQEVHFYVQLSAGCHELIADITLISNSNYSFHS